MRARNQPVYGQVPTSTKVSIFVFLSPRPVFLVQHRLLLLRQFLLPLSKHLQPKSQFQYPFNHLHTSKYQLNITQVFSSYIKNYWGWLVGLKFNPTHTPFFIISFPQNRKSGLKRLIEVSSIFVALFSLFRCRDTRTRSICLNAFLSR